jgi:hypothetical protein
LILCLVAAAVVMLVCVLLPLTLMWIYLGFKSLVNEKNGLHQIQIETCQPINRMKDKKKKKKKKKKVFGSAHFVQPYFGVCFQ